MNNQIGDNNSNIEVSEKIENLHSKKVHTEYITIEAKPYSEARGTLEHIHDDPFGNIRRKNISEQ